MLEGRATTDLFDRIIQVLGVAYTFRPSLAIRHDLTRDIPAHHSSKHEDFSYFFKGDKDTIAKHQCALNLRTDPATGKLASHWPEPELAALLGKAHDIVAYTLANDLTAISLEARGRTEQMDGTYFGKVWSRSGSVGPKFVSALEIETSKLVVGLRIMRDGRIIYDRSYKILRSLRSFSEIPDRIVERFRRFGTKPPPSKMIKLENGFLPEGTLIMLGTGLIVQQRYFCEPGDELTVFCPAIGELTNSVVAPTFHTSNPRVR